MSDFMHIKQRLEKNYRGETVLITGHTGFKGGWLAYWLRLLGAHVIGYSTAPPTEPSFFKATELKQHITSLRADINDYSMLSCVVSEYKPDYIFHLAAQPIVRESYRNPRDTFMTNVMGTVNVLDCARLLDKPPICVCVTSDKCYANKEWDYAYRENDAMGGYDPYSASKGAAELVINAYRQSFFTNVNNIASVRAGNVIGGGDWAVDRIVPDCVRSIVADKEIIIRNAMAVRPWQFVLEPIFGYMLLGAKMNEENGDFSGAWNFGPSYNNCIQVGELVNRLLIKWGSGYWSRSTERAKEHEATLLKLDIAKAVTKLGWQPLYSIDTTIEKIIEWYKAYYYEAPTATIDVTVNQIKEYMNDIDKQYA